MRATLVAAAFLFAACAGDSLSPAEQDELALVPDFVESMAAAVDGSGIGGSGLPEDLALSAEQKAAIAALHDAFKQATSADVAALRALEAEAREAWRAGASREEIHAILARGAPILDRLHGAFEQLRDDIWAVYTPAQQEWIASHRPRPCGPGGPPPLSEEQRRQIHALQEAFLAEIRPDLELIKSVVAEAHHAGRNGASREEIAAILQRADAAKQRIRAAERRLHEAIEALLTPEQKAGRCGAGGPPPRP